MTIKIVQGHLKQTDDYGNVEEVGVSLIDLFNTFTSIQKELQKINFQLALLTETEVGGEESECEECQ